MKRVFGAGASLAAAALWIACPPGVAMSGALNLTVGLVDNYNSKPAAGQKKNDLALFTGVSMKFGAQ